MMDLRIMLAMCLLSEQAAVGEWFCVLPTQCIYVFCVDMRTNSDYFPIQH